MAAPGVFIVLEGSDGSGKGTQFNLLRERLEATGHDVAVFDFPRYDQASSHFVKAYLNGEYGQASSISPYAASMFFALDRFEAAQQIRAALESGKIVLANRFAGSNMAHQGSKFGRPAERRAFFVWADNLEYQLLGTPRPNLNIFLRVPAETSFELIKLKAERTYTKASHDEHEADINHLKESIAAYDLLCQLFPKDFKAIDCTRQGKLMTIPEINDKIWQLIGPLLPPPSKTARARTIQLAGKPNPVVEPPQPTNQHPKHMHSGLARVELLSSGARLVSQSKLTDEFFAPKGLSRELTESFRQFALNNLRGRQSLRKQLNKLTDGRRSRDIQAALDNATPLAFLEQGPLNTEDVSLWPPLAELKSQQPAGSRTRKANPTEDGVYAPNSDELISLVKTSYRNESEALAELTFSNSGQSYTQLIDDLDHMSYEEKLLKLRALIMREPTARQQFSYVFEVITNYPSVVEMIASRLINKTESQPPTVRFGYDIPTVIEDNGLAEWYSELFDASLESFSQLQAAQPAVAAYSVMRGHRWRWRIETNADKLAKNYSALTSPVKELYSQMKQQVTVANPIIGDYLGLVGAGRPKIKSKTSKR